MKKVYLASSWRNEDQPRMVELIRSWGFDVYDFRNPTEGNQGFAWAEIDPDWQQWSPLHFRFAVNNHPRAIEGFKLDKQALISSDIVVLLLPSGNSAHLEAAYHSGSGGTTLVHMPQPSEPELMYGLLTEITTTTDELEFALRLLK